MESNQTQHDTKQENANDDDTLYVDINPDNPITEIESLCMNCEKSGITKIMMTKIPFFKEIIIMAFECPHCFYKSSEVQHGQSLADHGIHFELNVVSQRVNILNNNYL
jgi:zinc finger protein